MSTSTQAKESSGGQSMTSSSTEANEELRRALKALAAFDASTLVNEDGSTNDGAQAELRRLQQAVDAAVIRAEPGVTDSGAGEVSHG